MVFVLNSRIKYISKLAGIESLGYAWSQVDNAVKKALADLELEGAEVSVEMVDQGTPASGSVSRVENSDRARFYFKIPLSSPSIKEIQDDCVITEAGTYYYSSGDGSITYNLNNAQMLQTIEIIGDMGDNYTQFGRTIPFYTNGIVGFYNEVGFSYAHIIILFKNGVPVMGLGYGQIQNCS